MTLPRPIRNATREAFDDVAVERVWRGIVTRRDRPARARAQQWSLALVTVALVLGLVVFLRRSPDSGPLRLVDGAPVVALSAVDAARTLALSDGSRIELRRGATFLPFENSGQSFGGTLRDGVATFDVRPGGPRRWTIACGLATVEVIGTRFEIETHPERVTVRVERGRVRVASANATRELTAGESAEIQATAPALAASAPPAPPPPPPPAPRHEPEPPRPPEPPRELRTPRPSATPPSWETLAQTGDYERAYDSLGPAGVAREARRADVGELLSLADVARLSGHPADAVAPLERVLQEGAADPRVPLAAFTLGRIELDALGRPARAADAFARAIALGLPAGLVEDGYARLVEARARAGDRAGARAAFEDYARKFPGREPPARMRRWIADENETPSPSP